MKIVYVDTIIFDLQRAGGISVYWYEIINRMLSDKDIEPYFIVSDAPKNNIYWEKLSLPKDRVIKCNKFLNRYRSVNYSESRKHVFMSSYYRVSGNRNAVNVTIVHDFTYEYYSNGLKKFIHHNQKMKAINKSQKVICISKNTQLDLNRFSKKRVESVVIYNGVSDKYKVMTDEEIAEAVKLFEAPIDKIINSGKYLLFIGQRGGYKNWKAAVEIFKQLADEYSMISVGGGEMTQQENEFLGHALTRHHYLTALSEDKLCLLYNKAYCLLYLSEYEGFGLPVAEAAQCGCPVVAMNRSSIPEIAEKNDLVQLVEKIEPLKSDLTHKESVKKFSWLATYDAIKEVIVDSTEF